jgi:hypothetical protein
VRSVSSARLKTIRGTGARHFRAPTNAGVDQTGPSEAQSRLEDALVDYFAIASIAQLWM